MTDDATLTRRAFGVGALASALAACAPNVPTSMTEPLRASRLIFLDSNGNRVNLDTLQSRLENKPSTLSFQFAACGDVCPVTGIALGEVSRQYPQMRHIVISTQPQYDFGGILENRLETGFMRMRGDTSPVVSTGLRTKENPNTIVLYPCLEGPNGEITHPSITNIEVNEEVDRRIAELQRRYFNLVTGENASVQHSGRVLVYSGAGNLAGQIYSYRDIEAEMPGILNEMGIEGRIR